MKLKIAALLTPVVLLTGALIWSQASNTPSADASRSCANYTVNAPVTDVASENGQDYILTTNGAVYTQCAPYYGGANGQPYFGGGRIADYLQLCVKSYQTTGYVIHATSGETYGYGDIHPCGYVY